MSEYKDMYFKLFNRVTDAIMALEGEDPEKARQILKDAQLASEETYINSNVE